MYIKIYFDNKPLFLCDVIDRTIEPYIHHDDAVFIDELNIHALKTMIHEMEQPAVHAGVYFHKDLDALKKAFFKKFTIIQAGGGFVQNEKNEMLVIFRRGKWDLPKGKLDKGETLEQCAIREVEEETGLRNVELLSPLTITYHTYHEGTHYVLKETHWFRMRVKPDQTLKPQLEEDIEKIIWADEKELEICLKNSFPSFSEVIQTALAKVH